jgi:hypothetical protein
VVHEAPLEPRRLTSRTCPDQEMAAIGSRDTSSAAGSSLIIRPGQVQDVAQMARVHVRCWQETYRGLMPDAVLDDPGFPAARERMWTHALTHERYRQNRVAVAERDGELVGIAMSGPPEDATAAWATQLYVLYVYAADHGTGLAGHCWSPSLPPRSRRYCGSPTLTLARRRSIASTASFPTGQPRSRTASARSAWSATCSTAVPVRHAGWAGR